MFLVLLLILPLLIALISYLKRDYVVFALSKRIKSSDHIPLTEKLVVVPGRTLFANTFDLLTVTSEYLFNRLRYYNAYSKGKSYILYYLFFPTYNITNAEDCEAVIQSQALLTKSILYNYLHPFLGQGLLTNTAEVWHSRRKLLTPTFHFNILQSFLEIFKEETQKFISELSRRSGQIVDLKDIVPEFTLNNIIETALGVKLTNIPGNDKYRQSIHDIEQLLVGYACSPWMLNKWIYTLFGNKKQLDSVIAIAHGFSNAIIKKKREEFLLLKRKTEKVDDFVGMKKRYAMLDTLLDAESKGLIDHEGICDEVNTFMFEGYDTTSACIIFTLLNLALHPDVQEKCFREVKDLDGNMTLFDYNKMDYLECVVKEVLRLYPSVSFIGRRCVKETIINGLILPPTTQINIHIFDIMRDPKHFPEPLRFDPDRFLPQNTTNRHPYAFLPFSAGPRNCIGQKFAMLEMKVLLAAILQNFSLTPVTKMEEITFAIGLVLRTQQRIKIRIDRRK